MKTTRALFTAIMLGVSAAPVQAQPALRTLVGEVGPPDADGVVAVELVMTNGGATAVTSQVPARISGEFELAGARTGVTLERAAGQPESVRIAPAGFAVLRFTLRPAITSTPQRTAVLSLPSIGVRGVAVDLPETPAVATAAVIDAPAAPATAPAVVTQSFASADADSGNAFLGNLSAYEPIYAVYGPGTTTDAKLQISFKYQLFGRHGARGAWLDGLHFAYTQRLYWNLGERSSPFRNVDYMPELFYGDYVVCKPGAIKASRAVQA